MPSALQSHSSHAADVALKRLNVGCGRNHLPGWINLDSADLKGIDVRFNLERCRQERIPLEDNSIDEFLLSHVIEHIHDSLAVMEELYRLAKPGAKCTIRVPHGASDDAWEDPTHVRAYFPNSFAFFGQPAYWRADYGYRGDWRTDKIQLVVHRREGQDTSPERIMTDLRTSRNVVAEMVATLTAVKPMRAPRRELHAHPELDIVINGNDT